MFSTFCSFFRSNSINVSIHLTNDLSILTPAIAQRVIDTANKTQWYQWAATGIFSTISIGTGLQVVRLSESIHPSDKSLLIAGISLIVFGGLAGATQYNNYRYYQTIHLPQLQKIASQV